MNDALRALRPLWIPGGILAAAALAAWLAPPLPPSLAGLATAGPYAALACAAALAWWFNRGRTFVIAASLLAGFAGWQLFPLRALYTALVVLVPLNCLAALVAAERGARYGAARLWLLLLSIEAILVAWIAAAGKSPLSGTAWLELLEQWWLRSPPAPFAARVAFAAAFAAAAWRAWPDCKPLAVGNAAAIAAFAIAAVWAASPAVYALFMAAAGVLLVAALLQESHHLAFRDALTGLPARRALEERLRSLGEDYAVAMVDVDHFKRFNDTHGHDVGDQVLRLVGGRLAQVDGGVAYRYGGEEFSVLFPQGDLAHAERTMEAMRRAIEEYRMAVRASDRPKEAEEGARRRSARSAEQVLSVTVSVGIAAPAAKGMPPWRVLAAADEALYRAKKAGRNRVSR